MKKTLPIHHACTRLLVAGLAALAVSYQAMGVPQRKTVYLADRTIYKWRNPATGGKELTIEGKNGGMKTFRRYGNGKRERIFVAPQ